jgi:hypothetical protein
MSNIILLIFFAVVGSYICAKSHAAGGSVIFALVAFALLLSTPVGAALPGVFSAFVTAVDRASAPAVSGPDGSGVDR